MAAYDPEFVEVSREMLLPHCVEYFEGIYRIPRNVERCIAHACSLGVEDSASIDVAVSSSGSETNSKSSLRGASLAQGQEILEAD